MEDEGNDGGPSSGMSMSTIEGGEEGGGEGVTVALMVVVALFE